MSLTFHHFRLTRWLTENKNFRAIKRKTCVLAVFFLFLCLITNFEQSSFAQTAYTITINSNGSISPSSAPISINGNIYTLNQDIFGSITIEKGGIVFDGAGHSINASSSFAALTTQAYPPLYGNYVSDIVIKNVIVCQARYGILLSNTNNSIVYNCIIANAEMGITVDIYGSGNSIIGNHLTEITDYALWIDTPNNTVISNTISDNSGTGIYFWARNGNIITENNFENNTVGINCWTSSQKSLGDLNLIYRNNFIDNAVPVFNQAIIYYNESKQLALPLNMWNNTNIGNYWSDYNGSDADNNGIGDTAHYIRDYGVDAIDTDYYPLMTRVDIEVQPLPTPTPTSTPTPTESPTITANPYSTPTSTPKAPPKNTTSPLTPQSTKVMANTPNGFINLTISGNITSAQMSNVMISATLTNVSFTITGDSYTAGVGNITVPKNAVHEGMPQVYIDNEPANSQGYTQDADNYYVWYTTHFSTHQVTIMFNAIPSPTSTLEPMSTSEPESTIIAVAISTVVIGVVIAGLLVYFKKRRGLVQKP